jgi:hypothetical protein
MVGWQVGLIHKSINVPYEELVALHVALVRPAIVERLAVRVVERRWFADMGHEEAAASFGITVYPDGQKRRYACSRRQCLGAI